MKSSGEKTSVLYTRFGLLLSKYNNELLNMHQYDIKPKKCGNKCCANYTILTVIFAVTSGKNVHGQPANKPKITL